MQRGAARDKSLGLRIVDAPDQAHELARHVAMKPGRSESVLHVEDARAEDHEIEIAHPGVSEGECNTRKIEGSGWSKLIEPMVLKRRRS